MPYNKSILTRLIGTQMQKNNLMYLTHFSQKAVSPLLHSQGSSVFLSLDKLFESRMLRTKLKSQTAQKIITSNYSKEVKQIFKELKKFREGVVSFESYS